MKHFLQIAGVTVGLLCAMLPGNASLAETTLETRQVALSENLKPGDRVGRLRFLGMLELPEVMHNSRRLSQLSGLAWDDDDGILYALSDKGSLFQLQPLFDGDTLTGVKLLQSLPLRELGSDKPLLGWRIDAESLDIVNGRNGRRGDAELVIGTERVPQILRFRTDGYAIGRHSLPAPADKAGSFRDPNRMLEAMCADSTLGVLAMPEVPLKNEREGYTRIFSVAGHSWFYPVASGDRITAMECLGQGQLLVLQQNYQNPFGQVVVMLRRVQLTPDSAAQPLKPETLVTLDSNKGFLMDNFEGLTRHRGNRFFMVSDNNDLFVQRTLLMYFELSDD
ncbi:MAG: esterase-like activity of phytase family protein [Pseudomonadota bacterium]